LRLLKLRHGAVRTDAKAVLATNAHRKRWEFAQDSIQCLKITEPED